MSGKSVTLRFHVATVAVCLCLMLTHQAGASPSIVWSGVQDIETTMFDTGDTYIDIDSNGTDDFKFRRYSTDVDAFALTVGNEFFCTRNEDPKYRPAARREAAGVVFDDSPVDPHVWWDNPEHHRQIMMAFSSGYWADADHDYMGVRFMNGVDLHYGWIQISLDGAMPHHMTIHSWAYETQSGVGIVAGMVPEPSTWALFLTGFVCLVGRLRYRCRKPSQR